MTGCLSSRINGIVLSRLFEAQSASKQRGLFGDGVFVDAGESVLRHGSHARKDAPIISERIVVAPQHFHNRAHGNFSAFECEYRRVGCVPP